MMQMGVWQEMQSALKSLSAEDLLRSPPVVQSACGPRVVVGGREVLCLCSNDYLCLAGDQAVKAAAVEAVRKWGVGAGASRLLSGTSEVHEELEQRLGRFKGTESAIVTSTGWTANRLAIHALAGRGDWVVGDKLNHASIIDAAMSSGATLRTFAHRDMRRLEALLDRYRARYRRCLIVTDSLFSMDGDVAPLRELVELKNRYDAQLLIDEAHATGVIGPGGRGVAELLEVEADIDAYVGTLSKAIGAVGGFVAGPRVLIETIRNTGRAFIYTTALPPAICAAALAALEIIEKQPGRRQRLGELAGEFRNELNEHGLDTGDSASQIIPVMIGDAGRAVRLSRQLLEGGFFVPAIRPPTVAKGTSRLRISLCAKHDAEDLHGLTSLLAASR